MHNGSRRRWGARWITASLTLGVLLLAGSLVWASRHDPAAGAAPRSSANDPGRAGFAREITRPEAALLRSAEEALVAKCMQQRGFPGWPNTVFEVPELPDFRYVLDDVGWARRHGYGNDVERTIDRLMAQDPRAAYIEALPPSRRSTALTALNGLPSADPRRRITATLPSGSTVHRDPGSCRSTAEASLYGPLSSWFTASQAAGDLTAMRQAMVVRDARFTTAVARWSRCMTAAGQPFTMPGQAKDAFPPGRNGSRTKEIRTATAEATCARSSGLAKVAMRLDEHYRAQVRRQYPQLVATWLDQRLAALPRARAALGE